MLLVLLVLGVVHVFGNSHVVGILGGGGSVLLVVLVL